MKTSHLLCLLVLVGLLAFSSQSLRISHADTPAMRKAAYGIATRTPWTTSRIRGSPEPPRPYRIVRSFPRLSFKNPLLMQNLPGSQRLFVGEQAGKIYSFPNDQTVSKADLLVDLAAALHSWDQRGKVKGFDSVYGLAFHPQFAQNRYCYICYVLASKSGEQLADGSRVSRFRVSDTDPPRVDPASEKILLTFLAGGHNGGCLQFGKDGYLYISTGDGADPNPPDRFNTGQDVSDLLSSILRIDVDHEDKGKAYAIPKDNPFVGLAGARPEIWAYGLRNPWRMSFDRVTGDLWVGDVGWELWEMVYRVRRGGNYGWSVMEGRQPVRPDSKRGPTPILPPTLDFPHTEAASITGGYVYRGQRLADLRGAYICGDWMTCKVWGTRFDDQDHILSHRELAQGTERIVAFGEDNDGELYFLKYDDAGSVHQLAANQVVTDSNARFPTRLSETGLFTSTKRHEPAPGVVAFSINAEQWADHATAERFVALPNHSSIKAYDAPVSVGDNFFRRPIFFPADGVLAKTLSIEMERGNPKSRRRLETQILHFEGMDCHGYTYRWNQEQSDAELVPAGGGEELLAIKDPQAPGGQRKQTWRFHSRAECMQCHNPWTGYALGFNLPQLNKQDDYDTVRADQLETLKHIGILTPLHQIQEKDRPGWKNPIPRLVEPFEPGATLEERARAYLHANCSHCHQLGAGGTADIELRFDVPLNQAKIIGVRPVQGGFDIPGAQIVAAGNPYRSALFYRMSKLGRGRMPHLGSEIVDERGLGLLRAWIEQIPGSMEESALVDKLRELDEPTALARERADETHLLREAAERIAHASGREFVTEQDRKQAESDFKGQASERVKGRGSARAEIVERLLSTTSGALFTAQALAEKRIPLSLRPQVIAAALARPDPQIRDLFERFIPDDERSARLGANIKPERVLTLKGSAARGKEVLLKTAGLQCMNCHRIGELGSTLGPDLSQIGKKYSRAQILESLLEPSKSIEPKYQTYVLETSAGQLHTGLLVRRDAAEVVLNTIGDKEIHVPTRNVNQLTPLKTSLMPEQLMRDLTAQQAADLVEYLSTLK
jgi:putative heme-binding domain-containing protein